MARQPDGGAMTAVNDAVLDVAKDKLNDLAAQFQNTVPDVGTRHDQALTGAGEFSSELQTGAAKFLIGWHEALSVCSESAGLVAANTHRYQLSFKKVDVDQQLTGTI